MPLTAATNLSKRGRNNWKEEKLVSQNDHLNACLFSFNDSDARSALSGGSGDHGQLKHDGSENFFSELSEKLASKLKHHYWA